MPLPSSDGSEYLPSNGERTDNAFFSDAWRPESEQQPVAEPQQDEYEPEDEGYEELHPFEVADYFLGEPDEEEQAAREAVQAEEDLADGTAVRQIADEQRELSELAWNLVDACPGIDSDEFREEAGPILGQLGQLYEMDSTEDELALLAQVWEELGGMERWGPDPEADAWARALHVPRGNIFAT